MSEDAVVLAAAVGVFLLVLAVMAALADWLDETSERRDARRRNR